MKGLEIILGTQCCSTGSGKARSWGERKIADFEGKGFLWLFAAMALSIVTFASIYRADT